MLSIEANKGFVCVFEFKFRDSRIKIIILLISMNLELWFVVWGKGNGKRVWKGPGPKKQSLSGEQKWLSMLSEKSCNCVIFSRSVIRN